MNLHNFLIRPIEEKDNLQIKQIIQSVLIEHHSLLEKLLDKAKKMGYDQCYLETMLRLPEANSLYKRFGFELLAKPIGNTGHYSCDAWYLKKL